MTDYAKLADLAAQAIWNAALDDDPEQGTWENVHEAVKTAARTEMEELARVLYPVFAGQALRAEAKNWTAGNIRQLLLIAAEEIEGDQ